MIGMILIMIAGVLCALDMYAQNNGRRLCAELKATAILAAAIGFAVASGVIEVTINF